VTLHPGLARSVAVREGRFNPFTYSIGLDLPYRESLAAAQDYPLQQPLSDEAVSRFNTFVTFLHEAGHLAQYVSTSFGLRTLRRTLIALRYLAESPGWDLPVGHTLLARAASWSDHDRRALHRFLAFLETFDQLRLHVEALDDPGDDELVQTWRPWSAHFFLDPDNDPRARSELAATLRQQGVLIHRLPHISVRRVGRYENAVVNAALLMENHAVLTELNQVYNATGMAADSLEELLQLAPRGHGYTAAIEYALAIGACDVRNLLPTVAVCIDVALMHDPFVLYDAPSIEQPAPGQHADQHPGERFIEACRAATAVRGIAEHSDVARFHNDLCQAMGLPSPDWMAARASEVANTLRSNVADGTWLGAAVELHARGLEVRLGRAGSFCVDLLASDGIFDVIDRCVDHLSFFDLRSRQPTAFRSQDVDLVTLHSLVFQALDQPRIDCPLKQGDPFYCDSALAGPNTLCVWENGECQLDVFERLCGLRPG
jgi:hypothetical protein